MKVHLVVLLGLCGLYTASGRTRYSSLYVRRHMGVVWLSGQYDLTHVNMKIWIWTILRKSDVTRNETRALFIAIKLKPGTILT